MLTTLLLAVGGLCGPGPESAGSVRAEGAAAGRGRNGFFVQPASGHPHGCLDHAPDAMQERIQARIGEYLRWTGGGRDGDRGDGGRAAPPKYPFFPMAGTLYRDIFPGGYVDLNPAPNAIQDFHCQVFAPYDGHAGTDCGVRTFNEVAIGVPIFAPLDGTVAFAQDGFSDMHTDGGSDDGNYVIIDHGGGRFGWYLHLKMNSVAFTTGQQVRAGQQIGKAASSGWSWGPHLHFQTMDAGNTTVFEPWAGACRPGESGFVSQPPTDDSTFLLDGGTTWADLFAGPQYPHAPTLSGQLEIADQYVTLWALVSTLPPNSTFVERIIRPDNTVVVDGGPYPLNNAVWWRNSSIFVYWYTPAISGWDAQHLGTWKYELAFNGQTVVSAPFELRAARTPEFNRPPSPFTIALEPVAPPSPRVSDVIFCRLNTHPVLDDPDYDTLSYQYLWTVNGATVRSVTSAAHSDAIPRNTAAGGDMVRCEVTAADGRGGVTGPVSRSVLVVNDCPADWNGNGQVQPADVAAFVNAWFGAVSAGTVGGDFDRDGVSTPADVAAFVSLWFASLSGC